MTFSLSSVTVEVPEPERVIVTGTPVRGDFFTRTRAEARKELGLEDDFSLSAKRVKFKPLAEEWIELMETTHEMKPATIIRIKTILTHEGKTIASEGVEGNYFDIINYAIFDLIHYTI